MNDRVEGSRHVHRCAARGGRSRFRYVRLVRDSKLIGKAFPYRHVRLALGSNAERALGLARDLDARYDAVEGGQIVKPELTLREAVDQYVGWLRDDRGRVAWGEVRRNLDLFLKFMGDVPLKQVSRSDVRRFHAVRGREVSGATANGALRDVKRLYFWALDEEFVSSNPAQRLRPFPVPRRAWRLPTGPEVRALMQAAEPWMRRLIVLLVSTGARLGEALRLDWSHVDFRGGSLKLIQTKTGDNELVMPMGRLLKEDLGSAWLEAGCPVKGPVFPGKGLGGCRDGAPVSREFKKLATRLGRPWLTLKIFRKVAGTEAWRRTGDVRVAQKMLGHSTPRITEEFYVRADEEARSRAVGAMDEFLGAEVDTKVDMVSGRETAPLAIANRDHN